MTCGKLHILCAPPATPDTRTRTGRAGEGKGAPDGGRAGEGPGGTRTTGRPAGADAGENPANDKNDKSFS